MSCFEKMFESAFMGTLEVKNRVVIAPMATGLASESGAVIPHARKRKAVLRHSSRASVKGMR